MCFFFLSSYHRALINTSNGPVIDLNVFLSFVSREEKKKKQKQEGFDTEEKTEISSVGSAADQGSKGGGGPSQQPLKRGQKVRVRR